MNFTKMQGAGNDFIIIDNRIEKLPQEALSPLAARLCTRRMSVGADGLMAIEYPEAGGDFRMMFFNADGTMGEMCGNGARCIVRYGYENGLGGEEINVETTAGMIQGWRLSENQYKIKLNEVTQLKLGLPLEIKGQIYQCGYVELGYPGVPHLVVEYPNLQETDLNSLRKLGKALRYHQALPKGANVNFYERAKDGVIFERTFERGVEDFTYACGTGTAAVAAVLTTAGIIGNDYVEVNMTGGTLRIDVEKNPDGTIKTLYLTGPTEVVAKGILKKE